MQGKRNIPLWRNRDYMLLWSGQSVSLVGYAVQNITLPLLILAVTHSATQAGIAAALETLSFAFLTLLAGVLVDHWNRKRVMIVCDIGRAIATDSIPLFSASYRSFLT